MSRPISKAKVRLTSQVTASSTTISFQATDTNRALTSVAMSDFGTYGYLTINPTGKVGNYGIVRFTSWSVSGSTITIGTLTWMTFQGNDTSGTAVEFPAGTLAVISNNHHLWNNVVRTEDAQTIAGVKTFSSSPVVPAPSNNTDAANKAYVDGVVTGGAADANTTTKGLVEQATAAETAAGGSTGGTSAKLFATPADIAAVIQNSSWVYAVDSVGTDSYAITLAPAVAGYAAGQVFVFKAGTANTGTASLNVSGLGAKTILKFNDQTLETGDIESGQIVVVAYDGTNFQMLNPPASSLLLANITNTEANTLTAGATSDASALHTHPLVKKLFVQGTDVSENATSETSIFSTTVTGGTLSTNNAIRVRIPFTASGDGIAEATFTLKFKYGSATSTMTATIHRNASSIGGWYEAVILATGATNTQRVIHDVLLGTTFGNQSSVAGFFVCKGHQSDTAAIDSTASQTLEVTMTVSLAGATATAQSVIAEIIT